MDFFISIAWLILWWALLLFWGNILLKWAIDIAHKLKLSHVVVWLTVVAIWTSTPEIIVSLIASYHWNTDLIVGNILWTNIANFLVILGFIACISPVFIQRWSVYFDIPAFALVNLILLIFVSDIFLNGSQQNTLSLWDGLMFLILVSIYLIYLVKHRWESTENVIEEELQKDHHMSLFKAFWYLSLWILILFIGAECFVDASVDIAKTLWLSEAFIWLTIVAIGTSMPELVTWVLAARQWKADIAVWNILWSGVMNILLILGISSLVWPIPFSENSFFDIYMIFWVLILFLIFASSKFKKIFFLKKGYTLWFPEWILFLVIYIIYVIARLFMDSGI